MVRGALKSRRNDDEPSTEPLHQLLGGMRQDAEAHTMPIAGVKKPRVSFHSVTSTTFVKDCDDPFRLSSPQERVLSPLSPAVPPVCQNEEEVTGGSSNWDRMPDSTGRRDSNTGGGELLLWQQLANKQSAAAAPFSTPERQSGSGKSSAPISTRSPCETPGDGEVTVDVPDVTDLIGEDEIAEMASAAVAPHVESLVATDEIHGEVTGELPDFAGLIDDDEMGSGKAAVAAEDMESSTGNSLTISNVARESRSPSVPGEWNLFQKFKEDRTDDEDDDKSVASSAVPADRPNMTTQDTIPDWNLFKQYKENRTHDEEDDTSAASSVATAERLNIAQACATQQEAARISHVSALKESTTDTFDFAGANQAFDKLKGLPSPSRNSPYRHPAPAQDTMKSKAASSSSGMRAPGLGLLAAVGRSPLAAALAERKERAAAARSPASGGWRSSRSPKQGLGSRSPASGGWKSSRSPNRGIRNILQGGNASAQPIMSESEQMLSSQGPSEPGLHPIQQLTGGHCSLFGTRTRIGWQEFVNHGKSAPAHYDDQASALNLDQASMLGMAPAAVGCPHVLKMHEALQQTRANCLELFVNDIAQDTEQKRNDYTVAKQMWEKSQDAPPVANELMQLLPHTESLEYDSFATSMNDWHQACKEGALLKWYSAKRSWLETDVQIAEQHTQGLKDEVERLNEATRKCTELTSEVHNSSKHMGHMSDLHEVKHAYQELQFDTLRRTQEEPELIGRKLPDLRAAVADEQNGNAALEQRIQELKQKVQGEEVKAKESRRAAMQQEFRKSVLEKQFYAHTSVLHKATEHAVCLRLRGNINLWVEKAIMESPLLVRVSLQLPDRSEHADPSMKIYPAFSRGLVVCAWCHTLALINGCSADKLFRRHLPEGRLEDMVSSENLQRFLRLFDVEVLRITDNLRTLRNVRKAVPEVEWFSAQLKNSPSGDEPSAELTVLLSVLRSHDILPGGIARPRTAEALAGKFDAPQCIIKFNASLVAQSRLIWSKPTVEPVVGCLDGKLVGEAMEREASHASLAEMLKAAVQAMQ